MSLGKLIIEFITALLSWLAAHQPAKQWWAAIDAIHKDTILTADSAKLGRLFLLQERYEAQHQPHDSVYAFFYYRKGLYQPETEPQKAIRYYDTALQINRAGGADCSVAFTGRICRQIAKRYNDLNQPDSAIQYYKEAITICQQYYRQRAGDFFISCKELSNIRREQGDFKEVLTIANLSISRKNTPLFTGNEDNLASNYYDAAMAATSLGRFALAKSFIQQAEERYTPDRYPDWWAYSKLVEADIAAGEKQWLMADTILTAFETQARRTNDTTLMLQVLPRKGNLYKQLYRYKAALAAYLQQLTWVGHSAFSDDQKVISYNNIGVMYDHLHQPFESLKWINKAFNVQLGTYADTNVLHNPTAAQLLSRPGRSSTFLNLQNKAEMLLRCYRLKGDSRYLAASAEAFRLDDTLLTDMRQHQTEEESKLWWRQQSRSFYQQALEMCYEKKNSALAYQYLEKSRAALLNSQLNELGATVTLSAEDRQTEKDLNTAVFNCLQRLAPLQPQDKEYINVRRQYDDTLAARQQFIHRLETRYPAYHAYKYAAAPTLQLLQQYLLQNRQQWVQYFLSDSLLFVLYADGNQLHFTRKVVHGMEKRLSDFSSLCANAQAHTSKSNYRSLISLSHSIYDTLLGNLPLHPGRLIVSADNTPVSFDALCKDIAKPRFMVQDFAISYAYSAGFLLRQYSLGEKSADKIFLGMAPVSFPSNFGLVPLDGSDNTLQQLGSFYPSSNLLTHQAATRQTFLKELPDYVVVTLFTHARKNNDSLEPVLYFSNDSVRLSELQTIRNPATQLADLSACETAAGYLANGEGVLSLSRGFALAGIPSTVASLWKADAAANYSIADSFHYYLSLDSAKDVALQRAKLAYIHQLQQTSGNEQLPVFPWAGIVLTGNAEALHFSTTKNFPYLLIAGLLVVAAIAATGAYTVSRKKAKQVQAQLRDFST